jgi:hypothetical protein
VTQGIKIIAITLSVMIVSIFCTVYLMSDFSQEKKMPLVHKLQFPLLLSGADQDSRQYLLPKGTSLYYDQAFPEGFVRFKIYVNVEGVKLESHESTEKFWLDPLTAFPVDASNLKKLLKEYPLSKDDLSSILKSSALSKDEVKDVLNDFLHQ